MRIIAGTARGRRIEAPAGRDTRPTLDRVRENLFNMLQTRVGDARVLDLFAGSGALSLEALSRGASFAVLVDRDRGANRAEERNIDTLGFRDRTRVIPADWRAAANRLRTEGEAFDLVFLDPPYAMTDLREVFEALEPLAGEGALIIVEHEGRVSPLVPENWMLTRSRTWGYCGVSFYQMEGKK